MSMNEQERSELERLKQRHALLEQQISVLANQLKRLESSLAEPRSAPAPAPAAAKPVEPETMAIPPIIPPDPVVPPLPSRITEPASTPIEPKPVAPALAQSIVTPSAPPPLPPVAPCEPPRVSTPQPKPSFELRLGTYWLVRIGAVLILTGLVFLGTLIHPRLGPGGKVAMLYLASGLLLGAGAW